VGGINKKEGVKEQWERETEREITFKMRHKKERQARKRNTTAIMKCYQHKQWKV